MRNKVGMFLALVAAAVLNPAVHADAAGGSSTPSAGGGKPQAGVQSVSAPLSQDIIFHVPVSLKNMIIPADYFHIIMCRIYKGPYNESQPQSNLVGYGEERIQLSGGSFSETVDVVVTPFDGHLPGEATFYRCNIGLSVGQGQGGATIPGDSSYTKPLQGTPFVPEVAGPIHPPATPKDGAVKRGFKPTQ